MSAEPRQDPDRVLKLEEAQAFSEHAMDELSAEVRELGKRVGELAALIARVEKRLAEGSQPEESSDQE